VRTSQVEYPDGGVKSCSPYVCKVGQSGAVCMSTCSTTADCVAGFVCDTTVQNGTCIDSGASGSDGSGCGCRAKPARAPGSALVGLLAVAALGLIRRHRRRGALAATVCALASSGCTAEGGNPAPSTPDGESDATLQSVARHLERAGISMSARNTAAGASRIEAHVGFGALDGFDARETVSGMLLHVQRLHVRESARRGSSAQMTFPGALAEGDILLSVSPGGIEEYSWLVCG
jgi:MYXO-CTERM domain-containing protein